MKILVNNQIFRELPIDLTRLTQHVMRDGLRTKFATLIHLSLIRTEQEIIEERAVEAGEEVVLNPTTISNKDNIKSNTTPPPDVFDEAEMEKNRNELVSIKKKTFVTINSVSPIFTSVSEKVSKKIRKYSRGKSGKYSHFWIYLPPHKRQSWICRQLCSEIRFQPHRTLIKRAEASFFDLIQSPDTHIITQVTLKTYNVIFKNYRQSLMKTYRREKY